MKSICLLVLTMILYSNADFSCQKSKILQLAGDVNSIVHTGISKIEETPNSIIVHYVDKAFSQGDFCEILIDSLSENELNSLYSDTKNFVDLSVSTEFCPEIHEISNLSEIIINVLSSGVGLNDTVNIEIKGLEDRFENILSILKIKLPYRYLRFNSPQESKTLFDIHVNIKKEGCNKLEVLTYRYSLFDPNFLITEIFNHYQLNLDSNKITANNPQNAGWICY